MANIGIQGKKKFLGYFAIEQDAHFAWFFAKIKQTDALITKHPQYAFPLSCYRDRLISDYCPF